MQLLSQNTKSSLENRGDASAALTSNLTESRLKVLNKQARSASGSSRLDLATQSFHTVLTAPESLVEWGSTAMHHGVNGDEAVCAQRW